MSSPNSRIFNEKSNARVPDTEMKFVTWSLKMRNLEGNDTSQYDRILQKVKSVQEATHARMLTVACRVSPFGVTKQMLVLRFSYVRT